MNEQTAGDLVGRALDASRAEHTELWLGSSRKGATRFANDAITQNLVSENATLSVRCAFGNRVGSARTNELSAESLTSAVRRAEEIAQASEPDTEYLPPLPPQEYESVHADADATAQFGPEGRADWVQRVVALASARGVRSAGSATTWESAQFLANSSGLRAQHRTTGARLVATAMTDSSSGWAAGTHWDVGELDAESMAQRAVDKADASRDPRDLEPAAYTVVLEPAAVAELLTFLVWSMDAKAAHEGRSAFAGLEGTNLAAESITLRSDPTHPECPGDPFGGEGLPSRKLSWIDRGRVANLIYSRFWAQKTGREPTGWPANVLLEGGSGSTDDLVARVDRGLLITRFWYIRHVDARKLLLTGMTRDGTFWIEGGRVRHGVKNVRFNFSPLEMLKNVERLGAPQRVGLDDLVPPLIVRDFRFTSGTSF
ncbi:MAG: peptidase C69 [Armatimonadetes bacterium CG_4_10_14_3_um_filter_66_18]|nr:TldD/PmbA family protein [Armatimonadota bacterium]OIP04745.1 MAG: hypothetical protein AUJ96_12010 [Armatimonadetes bacterium CG2_30_66_41]PIU90393.1 MAG: peptidase C69 [Armatimonadetes bacterium CG06_land_8_20_14_3_00_66_21]PIX46629.1 MAG: peptidase C69 [Armatimonadetes bacterium CG_4_8_14_3_um_filter_66_20]PIY40936.1 MAG: peptidase C69 [Armatimonadetes bacterium CG_4_10_14_3_um_filter_66_18]PIZ47375.1 MAG: peptidase C69 [Armatimonadetes bacterium CG_4_10_14_0_8_um_filter_66_14]PJB61132.